MQPLFLSELSMDLVSQAIEQVEDGKHLSANQMEQVMEVIIADGAEEAALTDLFTGLYRKSESADELVGAARAMRKAMTRIPCDRSPLIDTCGTGGGKSGAFNISTAAAFVAAACGAIVAKHGNRKSTSLTGSADVLSELGVNVQCSLETVAACLDRIGIAFCFAPLCHASVAHVTPVRRKLSHPTIFNLLGPLCNPASAPYQLLGAGRGETRVKLAHALAKLGARRALVVHSDDGLGEISHSAPTHASFVAEGQVTEMELTPEDFGISRGDRTAINVANPVESAAMIRGVLEGKQSAARDVTILNAAAALWVCELETDFRQAAARAANAIDHGDALAKLNQLIELTI